MVLPWTFILRKDYGKCKILLVTYLLKNCYLLLKTFRLERDNLPLFLSLPPPPPVTCQPYYNILLGPCLIVT